MRSDVYQRITDTIVHDFEQGVRLWMQPWSAEHAAARIVRPRRFNGLPYNGINVLMPWSAAMEKGYSAPIWMTFKQALVFEAHVRKGETGSLRPGSAVSAFTQLAGFENSLAGETEVGRARGNLVPVRNEVRSRAKIRGWPSVSDRDAPRRGSAARAPNSVWPRRSRRQACFRLEPVLDAIAGVADACGPCRRVVVLGRHDQERRPDQPFRDPHA